jgi:hypothetical protein
MRDPVQCIRDSRRLGRRGVIPAGQDHLNGCQRRPGRTRRIRNARRLRNRN